MLEKGHFLIGSLIIKTILMTKSPLILSIFLGAISGILLCQLALPTVASAISEDSTVKLCKAVRQYEVAKTIKMMITAYSSTLDQTDDTPFITASGSHVADGIIANNMLPFGTKVRIPDLYGDKVFVVEDRMHKRKGNYHADIWFETYKEAKNFGAKITEIEVLES